MVGNATGNYNRPPLPETPRVPLALLEADRLDFGED